jgi:hypothetical protein
MNRGKTDLNCISEAKNFQKTPLLYFLSPASPLLPLSCISFTSSLLHLLYFLSPAFPLLPLSCISSTSIFASPLPLYLSLLPLLSISPYQVLTTVDPHHSISMLAIYLSLPSIDHCRSTPLNIHACYLSLLTKY